jgi:hypothetical protein
VSARVQTAERVPLTDVCKANGRDADTNPSWYVINNSNVAAASGNTVANGAYYLGRPWRDYARVTFQNTALSAVINSAGWHIWSTATPNTDHVSYTEFANTDEGKLLEHVNKCGEHDDDLGQRVSELGGQRVPQVEEGTSRPERIRSMSLLSMYIFGRESHVHAQGKYQSIASLRIHNPNGLSVMVPVDPQSCNLIAIISTASHCPPML